MFIQCLAGFDAHLDILCSSVHKHDWHYHIHVHRIWTNKIRTNQEKKMVGVGFTSPAPEGPRVTHPTSSWRGKLLSACTHVEQCCYSSLGYQSTSEHYTNISTDNPNMGVPAFWLTASLRILSQGTITPRSITLEEKTCCCQWTTYRLNAPFKWLTGLKPSLHLEQNSLLQFKWWINWVETTLNYS